MILLTLLKELFRLSGYETVCRRFMLFPTVPLSVFFASLLLRTFFRMCGESIESAVKAKLPEDVEAMALILARLKHCHGKSCYESLIQSQMCGMCLHLLSSCWRRVGLLGCLDYGFYCNPFLLIATRRNHPFAHVRLRDCRRLYII